MEAQTAEFHCMAESLKSKLLTVQAKDKKLTSDLEMLKVKEQEFKVTQEAFQENLARMKEINQIQENRVKLDVGGQHFMTSVSTLTSDPASLLATMFSGVHPITKSEDGTYFIDRDGRHFRLILNYLRDGSTCDLESLRTNQNPALLPELLAEAEYYKISGLVQALQSILGNTDSESGEQTTKKPLRRLYNKGQNVSSESVL